MNLTPEQLTEANFQDFLNMNRDYIFVHRTEDFEHPQYFPVAKLLTKSARVSGKFARQC